MAVNANHLSKDWVYVDKTKVYVNKVSGSTNTDARHLNAKFGPTNVSAPNDFKYLTTDNSNTAPYLKPQP